MSVYNHSLFVETFEKLSIKKKTLLQALESKFSTFDSMIFARQEIPCKNFALFSASPRNSFLRLYSQEIRDLCDLHCFNNISLGFMEIEGVSLYITKPWLNPYLEPEIGWKEMYSQTLTFSRLRAEKFYLKRKFSRPNNSKMTNFTNRGRSQDWY